MHKRRFNLLELTIVVVIILVLAALLLPSLYKTKDKARLVICQGNLKQILTAGNLYLKDNDLGFPSKGKGCIIDYKVWAGKAGVESSWLSGDRFLNTYLGFEGTATNKTTALQVTECPSDTGTHGGIYPRPKGVYDTLGTSYFYNSGANSNSNSKGLYKRKLSDVISPSSMIYANDLSFNAFGGGFNPFHTAYWHDRDINGYGTIGFIDGHVGLRNSTLQTYLRGDDWTFVYYD